MNLSTPLLDQFRQGDVTRDVRLLAAQGGLAARALEQIGLLMLLVRDPDTEVAGLADATLRAIAPEVLAAFLAGAEVPAEMRAFFAARGIVPATSAASSPDDAPIVTVPDAVDQEPAEPQDEGSLVQRIAAMTVAQRVVRAMKGTREERAILIRDANKLVSAAVLSSPKITDTEIESIARMANVSEDVLRIIGRTRAWVKSYAVMAALARNPKTPVAMSMNFLPRLTDKDLKLISIDRNVPDVLRTTARRKVVSEK